MDSRTDWEGKTYKAPTLFRMWQGLGQLWTKTNEDGIDVVRKLQCQQLGSTEMCSDNSEQKRANEREFLTASKCNTCVRSRVIFHKRQALLVKMCPGKLHIQIPVL